MSYTNAFILLDNRHGTLAQPEIFQKWDHNLCHLKYLII